jgi:hypothetical protein
MLSRICACSIQLAEIVLGIGRIDFAPVGVGGTKGLDDVFDIDLGVRHRLPGVGVMSPSVKDGLAVSEMVVPATGLFPRFDTIGEGNDLGFCGAGCDQALQKAFELQAVCQNDIGPCQGDGIGRLGLINVRIAIRTDQRLELYAVAANLAREVTNYGEGGHHR